MPLAASLPFLGLARPASSVRLPNGCVFRYVSKDDVRFLYKEIYTERGYLRHGIQLQQGDTVIDVGANIGLFSAFAAEAVGPEVGAASIQLCCIEGEAYPQVLKTVSLLSCCQ